MKTVVLKRILGRAWKCINNNSPRTVILIYHAVGDGSAAVSDASFGQQIRWLTDNTTCISLDELNESVHGVPTIRSCITFDDGYESVYTNAFPALHALGLTATVYVNSGNLGCDCNPESDTSMGHYPGQKFMSWQQVRALANAGWTVGSHGVEHVDLTALQLDQMECQLMQSRLQIENELHRPCRHFAFTWGRSNRLVRQEVARAGYRTAVGGIHGDATRCVDPYALPRIDIRAEYTLDDFVNAVKGDWDYLAYSQKLRNLLRA